MAYTSVWMQNYTYVDPIVDPFALFLALVVTALVAAGLTAVWTMRDGSTSSLGAAPVDDFRDGEPEPFISDRYRVNSVNEDLAGEKKRATSSPELTGHPAGARLDGEADDQDGSSASDSKTNIWSGT